MILDQLSLAKELIRIDTSTSTGKTLECAKYLSDLLEKNDFNCRLLKKGKDANLLASYGRTPELIFSGHMDTVDPDPKEWDFDPWKPRIKNGKLFGLGSCDMKSQIVCAVSSVLNNKSKMKKGCKFVFTFDEETGFTGINSIPKPYLKNKYTIVCEPSGLYTVIAHKGIIRFAFTVYGKSAHGSTPWKGVNALDHAIKLETQILELNKSLLKRKNSILGFPAYNLGVLNGGRETNIVPSEALMKFEYRLIPELSAKKVISNVSSLINSYCKKNKLKYNLIYKYLTGPFFESKTSKFASKIREISGKDYLFFTGATEAPFFQRAGAQTVIFGPGKGMEHKANEFIELSQLKKGAKLYEKIIREFC